MGLIDKAMQGLEPGAPDPIDTEAQDKLYQQMCALKDTVDARLAARRQQADAGAADAANDDGAAGDMSARAESSPDPALQSLPRSEPGFGLIARAMSGNGATTDDPAQSGYVCTLAPAAGSVQEPGFPRPDSQGVVLRSAVQTDAFGNTRGDRFAYANTSEGNSALKNFDESRASRAAPLRLREW